MNRKFSNEFISSKNYKKYSLSIEQEVNGNVKEGKLYNPETGEVVNIVNYIPRFVTSEDYTDTFGYHWNIFRKTQIDSVQKNKLTEKDSEDIGKLIKKSVRIQSKFWSNSV